MRYGDDPYVWACWLYYEDGLTQSEIADVMGISRATVNSYLAEARDKGIVNISLEGGRLESLSVAQELKRHFGLTDCLIIPHDDNARPLIDRLGVAGAHALNKILKSGDTLAVAWGRTVLSVGEQTAIGSLQDMTVVQATGGTTASFPYTPERCAAALAEAVSARCVNIMAPAMVRSQQTRDVLLEEPLLQEQFATLENANRILFGVSSLRSNSTIHTSGFFESVSLQQYLAAGAVGVVAGRFIDERGKPVAGGFDKVPALLAALRGGFINVLVTDAATGLGILRADGVIDLDARLSQKPKTNQVPTAFRVRVKKLLNNPNEVVEEMLDGIVRAHSKFVQPIGGSNRALVARDGPRPGKVGLVIGGGAGHEPCFVGYVGKGLADAVAVGNVFSSPPPDPIVQCALAASNGEGVLFVYGNYAGDVMNFEMAAEMAEEKGVRIKTVLTTDDIASSPIDDKDGRRGVAGNFFVFKVAGAACDKGLSLDACEIVTRKANSRTYTIGVALEPDMEIGVGIHGEPGVSRDRIRQADEIVDGIMDRIFNEMKAVPGDRVAVLVNSFGATPLMELYVLYRRVAQRLEAKNIHIEAQLDRALLHISGYGRSVDINHAS
ncbi:dak1 domain-containing protein [Ditylenchus destructor]|nr:dak1 domain-containing protein [Ditylenchus destructor]